MTNIEQMIQDLCPNGVEFKPLGEVCEMKRGSTITANQAEDGYIPVIAGGQKPAYFHNQSNREGKNITVAGSGAYAGYVAYWEQPIFVSDAFTVTPKEASLDIKFVYYFLTNIQDKIYHTKKGSGVPHVHPSSIADFEIPLPPLEIQKKIVECLDKFSALAAELQAELQKRRTQYEYYRTRLLTPPPTENISSDNSTDESNWEWKTLGEVATLSRGKVYSKEYLRDNAGEYPVYSSQTANNGELGRINSYDYDGDYLTWTTDGAYAGTVFRRTGKFSITNVCGLISNVDKSLSIDFLFYWLNKVAKGYVYQGMGNPKLMSNIMSTVVVAIPPLSEQKRIVDFLDKLEALTTSLSEGIPAEQAAQQKRYEYYRDKLLTFDRKNV